MDILSTWDLKHVQIYSQGGLCTSIYWILSSYDLHIINDNQDIMQPNVVTYSPPLPHKINK